MFWKARWGWILAVAAIAAGAWFLWLRPDSESEDRVVLDRSIDLGSWLERQMRISPDPDDRIPGEMILERQPLPFLPVPIGKPVRLERIPVHPKAEFHAQLGVDPESWAENPVPIVFSLQVFDGDGEQVATTKTTLTPGEDRWRPFMVRLEPSVVGDVVDLVLATDAEGNPPIRCGFGAPVLRSDGVSRKRTEAFTERRSILLDLLTAFEPSSVLSAPEDFEPAVIPFSLGSERVDSSGQRQALVTPPGSRVAWTLEAPPEAVLSVDLGLAKTTDASDGVTFRIRVDDRLVFERHLGPEDIGIWVPVRVGLSSSDAWRGSARLLLETDAGPSGDSTGDLAAWAGATVTARDTTPVPPAATRERPNVILITVDTLRADRLSCYGYERATSPNLEAFAADGLLFENATSPSSWTWPSTATILTGLMPPAHGVNTGDSSFLSDSLETLAERLRRRGLLTYAVTANPLVGPEKNFDQGFDVFDTLPWSSGAAVNTRFLNWLDARPDMRFFAYLHYFDPHSPYEDPRDPDGALYDPSYNGPLDGSSINALISQINWNQPPEGGPLEFTDRDIRHLSARYDGCINYWDEQFGLLIDALHDRGAWDNTIIILTSDHGEAFLEHGLIAHVSNLHQEVLHVPLIIGGGAFRGKPRRESKLIGLTAIMPTILRRSGVPVDLPLPGLDLLGPSPGVDVEHATTMLGRYGPERKSSPMGMIRTQQDKVIVTTVARTTELYNLKSDPGELTNRAASEPAKVKQLQGHLVEWTHSESARAPRYRFSVDDETRETLQRLGYVGGGHGRERRPKKQENDNAPDDGR